jgi:hypothetical protein
MQHDARRRFNDNININLEIKSKGGRMNLFSAGRTATDRSYFFFYKDCNIMRDCQLVM